MSTTWSCGRAHTVYLFLHPILISPNIIVAEELDTAIIFPSTKLLKKKGVVSPVLKSKKFPVCSLHQKMQKGSYGEG